MRKRRTGWRTVTLAGVLAACTSDLAPEPPLTNVRPSSPVDCVAVLGALPGTMAQTPSSAVPASGLDREKTIAMLDDSELARLCDFDVCLRVNGYLRKCYGCSDIRGDARYQCEAAPPIAQRMSKCLPNVDLPLDLNAERAWGVRQD